MGAAEEVQVLSLKLSLGAMWGLWCHGPIFTRFGCNRQCEIYFLCPQHNQVYIQGSSGVAILWTPVSRTPGIQSSNPSICSSPTIACHLNVQIRHAHKHLGVWSWGQGWGARPACTHVLVPVPSAHRYWVAITLHGCLVCSPPPAPSTPCSSCCLILLNTESQPQVNWFYSSLLYLPLNEEMPPIKF